MTAFPLRSEKKNEAYAAYFTGQSWLSSLVAEKDIPAQVAHVSFEPGCRNNWHTHTGGYQLLLVTAGEGWYQEAGQPARPLKTGDIVVIRDGVKHWHGARRNSWFSHIAITAGTAHWFESVSDAHYAALED